MKQVIDNRSNNSKRRQFGEEVNKAITRKKSVMQNTNTGNISRGKRREDEEEEEVISGIFRRKLKKNATGGSGKNEQKPFFEYYFIAFSFCPLPNGHQETFWNGHCCCCSIHAHYPFASTSKIGFSFFLQTK